jgi:hypothetical protein
MGKISHQNLLGAIQIIRDTFLVLSLPPPHVTFLYFQSAIFRPKFLGNTRLIRKKVSFEALLSCPAIKHFSSLKLHLKKQKKTV